MILFSIFDKKSSVNEFFLAEGITSAQRYVAMLMQNSGVYFNFSDDFQLLSFGNVEDFTAGITAVVLNGFSEIKREYFPLKEIASVEDEV